MPTCSVWERRSRIPAPYRLVIVTLRETRGFGALRPTRVFVRAVFGTGVGDLARHRARGGTFAIGACHLKLFSIECPLSSFAINERISPAGEFVSCAKRGLLQ
jgi:hypothetical protein